VIAGVGDFVVVGISFVGIIVGEGIPVEKIIVLVGVGDVEAERTLSIFFFDSFCDDVTE